MRDKKGVVRVIEAFLASVLLMSCLAMIPPQPNTNDSTKNLSTTAQNLLLSLDSNGHLASLIDERNWASMSNLIQASLPLTTWFNLTVFNAGMKALNDYPICNGGDVSGNIVSVNYVCASRNSSFNIYVLQLQLSQAGST